MSPKRPRADSQHYQRRSAREYAALFSISAEQLKLAEMAVLRAVDWRVRAPTVGDFLQLLAERERNR